MFAPKIFPSTFWRPREKNLVVLSSQVSVQDQVTSSTCSFGVAQKVNKEPARNITKPPTKRCLIWYCLFSCSFLQRLTFQQRLRIPCAAQWWSVFKKLVCPRFLVWVVLFYMVLSGCKPIFLSWFFEVFIIWIKVEPLTDRLQVRLPTVNSNPWAYDQYCYL